MAVGHEVEKRKATRSSRNGGAPEITTAQLEQLLAGLNAARDGDARVRLPVRGKGLAADLARAFNELAERRAVLGSEISRVGRAIA